MNQWIHILKFLTFTSGIVDIDRLSPQNKSSLGFPIIFKSVRDTEMKILRTVGLGVSLSCLLAVNKVYLLLLLLFFLKEVVVVVVVVLPKWKISSLNERPVVQKYS